ncbi:peptide ABC transporter ATP-binding protein [Petrotoga sp. 9PW.55.5.1]|uniref:ABC transporter ATP-binding protein n=1 Tax=Petrotoga sp. 9PW.55.5.1 TaxID=1308979 RepID=UPI000DC31CD2|nr:ABC transporter ATP-binding protein [Petrotoga sp. 9PW.55.5.1]RAO99606.1 peptide ABC transporter ATP-binding protein [Petrotoga sp. 9PW.55.5.1]
MSNQTLLTVNNLSVYIYANQRCNKAVQDISFEVKKGKILGIIGESGCGKSITASAIMQLLPEFARIEHGEIVFHDNEENIRIDKLEKNSSEMRKIRGEKMAMIFQDPMVALNPVYTVGFQIMESLRYHMNMSKRQAKCRTIELLKEMGISSPDRRVHEYPHQFSGGMRQRAMIAMAMACNPKLLIADEPTTAIDVTIQAQIFELMLKLQNQYNMTIMLITHDMGVIAELADNVIVMYMGNIVESGNIQDILTKPAHPYTKALLKCMPVLGKGKNQEIEPIRGITPDPYDRPTGCQFYPRCDFHSDECLKVPKTSYINEFHSVKCWHYMKVLDNE